MTFKEVYEEVIQLWGHVIDISDALIIEKKSGKSTIFKHTDSENFYSPQLSLISKAAIEKAKEIGVLQGIMAWAIFDVINKKAAELFQLQITNINPKDIDLQVLEKLFLNQLKEDGYIDELNQITNL